MRALRKLICMVLHRNVRKHIECNVLIGGGSLLACCRCGSTFRHRDVYPLDYGRSAT